MGIRESDKLGKWLEGVVQTHLTTLSSRRELRYLRLNDTRAARGAPMTAQPCDFLIGREGKAIMLECKCSDAHSTFADCLGILRDSQRGQMLLWAKDAQWRAFILFYARLHHVVELWDVPASLEPGGGLIEEAAPALRLEDTTLGKGAKHLQTIKEITDVPFKHG